MSVLEKTTDGISGMDAAKKYLSGDLDKPVHGYSGKKAPNGSLINGKIREYGGKTERDASEDKIIESFPFIKEETDIEKADEGRL